MCGHVGPNVQTRIHPSIIEKLERELETHRIELAIDGTYKRSYIKDMRTDAVTDLDVRIQVRHEKHTAIQAFLLNHPQPTVQGAQQDEG